MLTNVDIDILDTYFKSLQVIPDELDIIVQKIDKLNIINNANEDLIRLMQNGESED